MDSSPPTLSIDAVFASDGINPNPALDTARVLMVADVIVAVDVMCRNRLPMLGRKEVQEIIDSGQSKDLRVLHIERDLDTTELELLIALLLGVKGRCDSPLRCLWLVRNSSSGRHRGGDGVIPEPMLVQEMLVRTAERFRCRCSAMLHAESLLCESSAWIPYVNGLDRHDDSSHALGLFCDLDSAKSVAAEERSHAHLPHF
jgi:hypothetical protein